MAMLSVEERHLLDYLEDEACRGGRPRPVKSAARDRLQKLGLIETARPHRIASNTKLFWRPTSAGSELSRGRA